MHRRACASSRSSFARCGLRRRCRIGDAVTYRNAKLKPSLNIAGAIRRTRNVRKALPQAMRRFRAALRESENVMGYRLPERT